MSYLVHKSVEMDKLRVSVRNKLTVEDVAARYFALRKYDGCCAVLVVEAGGAYVLSRTGEPVPSMQEQAYRVARDMPGKSGVFFAEAWMPGQDFQYISGKFRQHAPCPELEFRFWDMVTVEEFDHGLSARTFMQRFADLRSLVNSHFVADWYNPGTYGDPEALAKFLVLQGGYDGLVCKDPYGGWVKGHSGNTGEAIKFKPILSSEHRVTGIQEGGGRNAGKVGNIVVDFNYKACGVGTGINIDDAQRWWADPDLIIGKTVEVEYLGLWRSGLPREPRFKGIRTDVI